jgi:hypothetical protein
LEGKTKGDERGSTVKGKRTPFLRQRSGNSPSNIDVNLFLIPRLSRIDQSFRTEEITSIARTIAPSETYLREVFLHSKITLIREKTALIFSEYSILLPIGLSGAESTQKITANSTYWEAKLNGAGGIARSKGKEHLF